MLFPAKVKVALAGLVVAGGAAVTAILGPAGPAVGQSSPSVQLQIQVNSPATLVAKGAGVEVSVTASCSTQLVEISSVSVFLIQNVGVGIANGGGGDSIDCTGTPQTLEVLVTAEAGHTFKKGAVLAEGTVSGCEAPFFPCFSQQVTPTIEISK